MRFLRNETVCFTGHRYTPRDAFDPTVAAIDKLARNGCSTFLAGGALGFDTVAARAVLRVREQFPFVKLILALPCPEQDFRWNAADRETYRDLLSRADAVVLLSDHYDPSVMHVRNHFMVDNSFLCVAWYDGSAGGTRSTVLYARSRGVPVLNLCPHTTDSEQLTLDLFSEDCLPGDEPEEPQSGAFDPLE